MVILTNLFLLCGITPEADEELSPSLENFIVVTWLQLLHPDLPRLVKQRYGTEPRCRTLVSIKPEISQALDSLLQELRTSKEAKVPRTIQTSFGRPPRIDNRPPASNRPYPTKSKTTYKPSPNKSCALCLQAGRPDYRSHFLSTCQYLPDSDRQFMARARHVTDIEDTQEYEGNHPEDNFPTSQSNCDCNHPINHRSATCRVNITQSPYLHVFYNQNPLRLTIDTGAETNMIKASLAHYIGCPISKSSQLALQADGLYCRRNSPVIVP